MFPELQRPKVRQILILQFNLGLHSQSIDFTSNFYQSYIPRGEQVFIKITRYFNSDGGQCDVVLRLKKTPYS